MLPLQEGKLVARFHVLQLLKLFLRPRKPDLLFFEVLLSSPQAGTQQSYKKLRTSYKKLRTGYEKLRKVTKSYQQVTK